MLPILPKILLWKDKENITEFFDLDEVNEEFYEVLGEIEDMPHLGRIDEVKLFNEVYYQATRMQYEHAMPNDLKRYIAEIKANVGWKFGAELVLTMIYYLLQLLEKPERRTNQFFFNSIRETCFESVYWKPFKRCYERLKMEKKVLEYSFKPCPHSPIDVRYKYCIHWDKITQNYELSCIEHVLNLWDDKMLVSNRGTTRIAAEAASLQRSIKRQAMVTGLPDRLTRPSLRSRARRACFQTICSGTRLPFRACAGSHLPPALLSETRNA